ncbi:hypothetical protein [Piscinibacter koreensis]|nr:hypothetical protein [Schlegelella koreensis]
MSLAVAKRLIRVGIDHAGAAMLASSARRVGVAHSFRRIDLA